jgi:hypothetical protein
MPKIVTLEGARLASAYVVWERVISLSVSHAEPSRQADRSEVVGKRRSRISGLNAVSQPWQVTRGPFLVILRPKRAHIGACLLVCCTFTTCRAATRC